MCRSVLYQLFLFRSFGFLVFLLFVFFFKQKTAYEMRISDWSSDVCSSDLLLPAPAPPACRTALSDNRRRHEDHRWDWLPARRLPPRLVSIRGRQIGRASCRERVCQYV